MKRLLSILFETGVRVRWWLYRAGFLQTRSLSNPVISVGNLSLGGTGKTPYAAYLARILREAGYQPIILSRGYRGRHPGKALLVSDGKNLLATPKECGDEAYWLARELAGVPVVVSKDRYLAGRLIEDQFDRVIHILDDGFQHLKLARDLDIVLIDGSRPLSQSRLLPLGRLREPLQALSRADLVIITRAHLARSCEETELLIRRINPQMPISYFYHDAVGLQDVRSGKTRPLGQFVGQSVIALAAIGNPDVFLADLRHYQFRVVANHTFRDHHPFTQSELDRVLDERRRTGARGIVTTEKDAIRLERLQFQAGEILALKIEPRPESESDYRKSILDEVNSIAARVPSREPSREKRT